MKGKLLLLLILTTILLTACAANMTVKPIYQPPAEEKTLLSTIPPLKIKLLNFKDERAQGTEAIFIGRREAAFGVPMGDIFSDPPIFEIVRDSIKAELIRDGHSIVTENEDFSMKGEIQKFWVRTEVTPLYWDVVGEVSILLEVKNSDSGTSTVLGPYSGKTVERTYVNPGEDIVTRVLVKSLGDVVHSMSSDTELARVLKVKK